MPELSPSERATFIQPAPPSIALTPTNEASDFRAARDANLTALALSAKKLATAVASWREREGELPDDAAYKEETGLTDLEKAAKRLAAGLVSWRAKQVKKPIADDTTSIPLPLTASSTAALLEESATEKPATPSPEEQYASALEQLETYHTENAKLHAHIRELITAVKAFKATNSKNGPLTTLLTGVLKTTFDRVNGNEQMDKQKYDEIVNSMQRSRSKTLRILGGIMLVIGVLALIAFPITAAAVVLTGTVAVTITASTTATAAGGLITGGLTGWAGYEFFTRNKPATLITEMKKVGAAKELADLELQSSATSTYSPIN